MRVAVETRKAFYVRIGKVRRRFWDEPAAYRALAKAMLLKRYGWLNKYKAGDAPGCPSCDRADDGLFSFPCKCDELPDWVNMDPAALVIRRARFDRLFTEDVDVSGEGHSSRYERMFIAARWTAYVRRVAKKMRAMDRRRAAP
jgi:hypothetical protein